MAPLRGGIYGVPLGLRRLVPVLGQGCASSPISSGWSGGGGGLLLMGLAGRWRSATAPQPQAKGHGDENPEL